MAATACAKLSDPAKQAKAAVATQSVSGRALTPNLTPQTVYEQFLLVTLAEVFEGSGDKRRVTKAVIDRLVKHGYIGPADLELVATGETKAENTITWGRNALKNQGLIRRGSKRGIWELTEDGREAAKMVELPKAGNRRT